MSELKVNKAEVRKKAQNLSDAVEDYLSFGNKPFDEERKLLKGMNTDFTAKFREILGNVNDTNKDIVKDLEGVANKAIEIIDKFEDIDEKGASQVKG